MTTALQSTTYVLRDYQQAAVDAAVAFMKAEHSRHGIIVVPTGGGKSLCVAAIVKELGEPTVIFQPSQEILMQNYGKMTSYGYRASIYSASLGKKEISNITFATIGTAINNWNAFRRFKYIIVDECHLVSSKNKADGTSGMYKTFFESLDKIKILGLSVGPKSIIELIGGPFENGFVGYIQDAFNIAIASGLHSYKSDGLDIIDLTNVFARGWDKYHFTWKTCKRMIRHSGNGIPMRTIRAHSNSISLTEDHSIYVAEKGASTRVMMGKSMQTRYLPVIKSPISSKVVKNDVLICDDGNYWTATAERTYDMIEFVSDKMPKSRARVVCEVSSIDKSILLKYASGKYKSKMVSRWRCQRSIPLSVYRSLGDIAPKCESIIVEGSSIKIARYIKLSDWAYVLGFYLGDGWLCSETKSIGRFGFAVEHGIKSKVRHALENMNGVVWKIRESQPARKNSGSVELRANNIFLYELIKHVCGQMSCYQKYIPGEWITSWTPQSRMLLLEGLKDSDGHEKNRLGNKKSNHYVTTSEYLADGLLSLLRSLGITGGKHLRKPALGGIVGGRQIIGRAIGYSVIWSGHSEDGNNSGHHGARTRFVHDKLHFREAVVQTNIESNSENYVYDLEMEGHPSFVASGFLVHNTATPYRLSSAGIGMGSMLKFLTRTNPRIFSEVVYYIQNKTLFDAGHLAKIKYFPVHGFSRANIKVNSTGADYDDRSLKRYYDSIGFKEKLVRAINRLLEIGRKNILVFTRFIEESRYLCNAIPGVAIVTGETEKSERNRILNDFKSGKIKVVTNCSVLCVGFDFPELETVVLARPTMSLALFYQVVGRGMRPAPSKDHLMFVDMCDNISLFGHVEDIRMEKDRKGLWIVTSGGRQMTNIPFQRPGTEQSNFFMRKNK